MITVLGHRGSRSRDALARALGVGKASVDSVRRCRGNRFVINWGSSQVPLNFRQRQLTYSNAPQAVSIIADKILTLTALSTENIPALEYMGARETARLTDGFRDIAEHWLEQDGKIVARHILNGHSGAGIEIVRRGNPIPDAPLYTRYFRKDAEYRVHMFYGEPILIQQKRRMREDRRDAANEDNESHLIRNHHNGWAFTTNNLDCDSRNYRARLCEVANLACVAVGANHGAVDLLVRHNSVDMPRDLVDTDYRDHDIRVCEINSAPSLDATSTLNAWANAFRSKFNAENIR